MNNSSLDCHLTQHFEAVYVQKSFTLQEGFLADEVSARINGNLGVLISRKNGDPGSHFHGCMGIGIPDFWTHFPAKTGLYKS